MRQEKERKEEKKRRKVSGVEVQWLDYLAVTQESGVQFPTAEKVASDVAPPSGHKLHFDVGYCRHGDVVRPQFSHSGST